MISNFKNHIRWKVDWLAKTMQREKSKILFQDNLSRVSRIFYSEIWKTLDSWFLIRNIEVRSFINMSLMEMVDMGRVVADTDGLCVDVVDTFRHPDVPAAIPKFLLMVFWIGVVKCRGRWYELWFIILSYIWVFTYWFLNKN